MLEMAEFNIKEYEIFDAENKILGRLSSVVAKRLLLGKKIAIINADKAVISGNRNFIVEKYKTRLNLMEKENPEHSPYWPRRPDMLVKRIIRGMLPYNKPHGKTAYRNLRVFMGKPPAFASAKISAMESKDPNKLYVSHMTIGELSELLGYDYNR
jgi:large subunit ribosomal protein L13